MAELEYYPDEDDEETCPYCGETGCLATCTSAILAGQAADFPRVQAQAQTLYAAFVSGLGPLGKALPAWDDLIDRQQYAWRCVARAGEDETASATPAEDVDP